MQRFRVLFFGVTVLGSSVFACVGDTTTTQGALNGPCFADNTCTAGLTCSLVGGAGKCVAAGDASASDGSVADASDSGTAACAFQTTTFPCGGQNPPTACYGATQTCTLTGCSGSTDLMWECFSPNQCSSLPCCVPAGAGNLVPGANCSQGALAMSSPDAGNGTGSTCATTGTCSQGDTQLCQSNSQCPKGKICSPVSVVGIPSAANVIIGACVPQ
jgi:hypothetical protein